MRSEESVLWEWEVFDADGKPHSLEEVLDTRLVRDLLKFERKSLLNMSKVLSMIVDPWTVTNATRPPVDLEPNPLDPYVEGLWRKRLDDEE